MARLASPTVDNPILIGGGGVTEKGRFHTDFTQNDVSRCVNLRDRVEGRDAKIAMKAKNDEKCTGEELSPPSPQPSLPGLGRWRFWVKKRSVLALSKDLSCSLNRLVGSAELGPRGLEKIASTTTLLANFCPGR